MSNRSGIAGKHPKDLTLDELKLEKSRCKETLAFCRKMHVKHFTNRLELINKIIAEYESKL